MQRGYRPYSPKFQIPRPDDQNIVQELLDLSKSQ